MEKLKKTDYSKGCKEHKRGKKWGRWDRFSWFGLRAVNEEDKSLKEIKNNTTNLSLVDVIESVLIEVFEPHLNNQEGKCTGEMYVQVQEKITKT